MDLILESYRFQIAAMDKVGNDPGEAGKQASNR